MHKNQFLIITFSLVVLVCLFAAGCSDRGSGQAGGSETISESQEGPVPGQQESPAPDMEEGETATAIDVDLTAMSSTMVYAEVYNILTNPDEYFGKIIKMSGPYYASYYDVTGQFYHYVIIEDAAACCQQGLEFIWSGKHNYPDDYPEDNVKIEVAGAFEQYDELGVTYYYLGVDEIKIL